MNFDPIDTKAKNKVSLNDTILIEERIATVKKLTKEFITMDDNTMYPTKLFNKWIRLARQIKERRLQADERFYKADKIFEDLIILRKEAKIIYDEKWRRKAMQYMGINTTLRKYILLSGGGSTIKFYMSRTHKADAKDLEKSYKSLHGIGYKAFAWGYYIKHEQNIALIGMQPYLNRNLSDARKEFALVCINRETTDEGQSIYAKLYSDMKEFMISERVVQEDTKLLSSLTAHEFHNEASNRIIPETKAPDIIGSFDKDEEDDGYPF